MRRLVGMTSRPRRRWVPLPSVCWCRSGEVECGARGVDLEKRSVMLDRMFCRSCSQTGARVHAFGAS